MTLYDLQQLEATRRKLRLLEEEIERIRSEGSAPSRVTELTLRSLSRLANQLKEEITRFEVANRP